MDTHGSEYQAEGSSANDATTANAIFDVLGALSGISRVKIGVADIDNAVFKLHYRFTSTLLFGLCILITANGLIGDPIHCLKDDNTKITEQVADTYCWIHTTYTLPRYIDKGYSPGKAVHPGVGPYVDDDEKVYHAYYQWVPFVLFVQAVFFYTPHWLWKTWEGGKLQSILMGLCLPVMCKEQRIEKVKLLADYLKSSCHFHNIYLLKFLFCECLNVANVFFNIWFIDKFLGGMFLTYGLDILRYTETDQENRTDPMIRIFPRVTKCDFRMFGASGTIEKHDIMCVLALNIVNEKIYVFLWFWFVLLALISCFGLLYRIIILSVPAIRLGLLQKRVRFHTDLEMIEKRSQIGDYFLLYMLSKNMELLSFTSLLEELSVNTGFNNKNIPDLKDPHSPLQQQPERLHLLNNEQA